VFTSVFILGSRHLMSRTVDAFQFIALAYSGSALGMLLALLARGADPTSGTALTDGILVIILGTVVPALLLYSAIRLIGAGSAARLATMEPLTAVVLSFLVLGEALTPGQIVGGVLVLTSVALLTASPEVLANPVIRPLAEP
jgi:drug/metabolite transporter (DMT)-like permease